MKALKCLFTVFINIFKCFVCTCIYYGNVIIVIHYILRCFDRTLIVWLFLSTAAAGSSNSDLASLFECPVCFDYALPPITQCQSGHIVCQPCKQKLNICPTCRGPLGKINPEKNKRANIFSMCH